MIRGDEGGRGREGVDGFKQIKFPLIKQIIPAMDSLVHMRQIFSIRRSDGEWAKMKPEMCWMYASELWQNFHGPLNNIEET
jgi:hypothetical protein